MRIQTVSLQRVRDAEPVEHAANAVDPEAPEGTFAVLMHQMLESAQLVRSSWVELQVATFPACPGVGRYSYKLRRLGLGECAERTSQVDQVQFCTVRWNRSIRHV